VVLNSKVMELHAVKQMAVGKLFSKRIPIEEYGKGV
jgi:hypothetical protein